MAAQFENPVLSDLKSRLGGLKSQALELLDVWHRYHTDERSRIMFVYDNIFGDLEEELDNKAESAALLERKLELINLKIRKGEKLTGTSLKFVDSVLQKERNRRNTDSNPVQRVQEKASNNSDSFASKLNLECEVNDAYELPQLYRQLVKKLHPDISGDTEYFQRYWDNIQFAYKSKDLQRMRVFYDALCVEDENYNFPDKKTAEISLKTRIRSLEMYVDREKKKIIELKNQEPFNFEDKLSDREWVAMRKNKLREKLIQIDNRIRHHNKMLSLITQRIERTGNGFVES